jgi:hypothetical protein
MAIDTEIMKREGFMSGTKLVQCRDEFIKKVKEQVGPISQEDCDELEDQNFHTAYRLLREAGLCPGRQNGASCADNSKKNSSPGLLGKEKWVSFQYYKANLSEEQIAKILAKDPASKASYAEALEFVEGVIASEE